MPDNIVVLGGGRGATFMIDDSFCILLYYFSAILLTPHFTFVRKVAIAGPPSIRTFQSVFGMVYRGSGSLWDMDLGM